MRPNIVLITVDQMRRDCLGIAGHPVVETPNLDQMLLQGWQFTHAVSATPSCIPARAALMTGQSQERNGRVGYQDGVEWRFPHTLAGELTAAGYHTYAVGKLHTAPERNLLGFNNVILHDGYHQFDRDMKVPQEEGHPAHDDYLQWLKRELGADADLLDSGMGCNSWLSRPFPYDERFHPTNWTVSESIDFFRRRDPTKPFFLYVSFVRPHSPLDPPKYYFDLYDRQSFPKPVCGDWADREDYTGGLNVNAFHGVIPDSAMHRAQASYYGLITHIDHQIGRLVQAMGDYRLLTNTVFIFLSDHGDMMGDHCFFRKGVPYEGSIGVPLLIWDPGNLIKGQRNRRISSLVELRDVMPTILDIAGVEIPPTVDGRSLVPLLRGDGDSVREVLHGEHSFRALSSQFIVTEHDKYIWFSQSGREQYFDLERDPNELHDLIADPCSQERIGELRADLIRALDGREEGYVENGRLVPGKKPVNVLSHPLEECGI